MDLPHSFLKRQQRIHKEENHFAAVIEVTFKNSLNALYFHIFMADHVIATLTSKYTAPLMNHWIPLGEESLGGKIFSNNSSSKVYTIHNLIIKLSTEILVLQWVLDYHLLGPGLPWSLKWCFYLNMSEFGNKLTWKIKNGTWIFKLRPNLFLSNCPKEFSQHDFLTSSYFLLRCVPRRLIIIIIIFAL